MYKRGKNRLFYQSKEETKQTIVVEIITPSLNTIGPLNMEFFNKGLYYIDVWFSDLGSHVFYVYENNVQKYRDILVVSSGKYVIYPDGEKIIY